MRALIWLSAAAAGSRLLLLHIRQSSSLPPELAAKILYNCKLSADLLKLSWGRRRRLEKDRELERRREIRRQIQLGQARPIALKYLAGGSVEAVEAAEDSAEVTAEPPVKFPFGLHSSWAGEALAAPAKATEATERQMPAGRQWMRDYEYYSEDEDDEVGRWETCYGTPDRSVSVSSVPCGGCGALLHCQDTAIPGYLPSELFAQRSEPQLRSLKCQRCHFLEHYHTALAVNVSAEDYPRLLSHLSTQHALVLLLLDVTDVPCSLWPGIIDIIGTKRPVIVAGNKADLLPPDGRGFLQRALDCLQQAVDGSELAAANVKHVCLLSARTGYGIEELITRLHSIWEYKGDVYILGCTNVGKSTLFNALLQSDYCKVQAVDLLQRATTSPWPGTTLNLLKFPILRPQGWRLRERVQRLQFQRNQHREEQAMRRLQLRQSGDPRFASLIGHLGRTFVDPGREAIGLDPFSLRITQPADPGPLLGINPAHKPYREGRWCFDTPGTVHPDQVLGLLTAEELGAALPSAMLLPRSFLIWPDHTLFVGGLARIDFLGVDRPGRVRFTVLAPEGLTVTVCRTEDADQLYGPLAAAGLLSVPRGSAARLAQWPGLQPAGPALELPPGLGSHQSCADLVLPSTGWVAVTPSRGQLCRLQPWTPHGRGAHLRDPPLLPGAVALRGPLIRRMPAYFRGRAVKLDA